MEGHDNSHSSIFHFTCSLKLCLLVLHLNFSFPTFCMRPLWQNNPIVFHSDHYQTTLKPSRHFLWVYDSLLYPPIYDEYGDTWWLFNFLGCYSTVSWAGPHCLLSCVVFTLCHFQIYSVYNEEFKRVRVDFCTGYHHWLTRTQSY